MDCVNRSYVSIIVPVYNPPIDNFKKFLESCVSQTLTNIDIILVNDASTNDALDIIIEYANTYENIKFINRKENGRAGKSRNDGFKIASGEYILFADADDILDNNICANLYKLAKDNNADIVGCSWTIENSDEKIVGKVKLTNDKYDLTTYNGQSKGINNLHNALWNKIFKREVIELIQFKPYEVNIGEDRLFNIEAFTRSKIFITTEYIGYRYFIHNTSATGRSSKGIKYLKVLKESEQDVVKILLDMNLSGIVKSQIDIWTLKYFIVGCRWIIDEYDNVAKFQMWKYWQKHYYEVIIRNKNKKNLLYWWVSFLCRFGPKSVWHLSWPILKGINKLKL